MKSTTDSDSRTAAHAIRAQSGSKGGEQSRDETAKFFAINKNVGGHEQDRTGDPCLQSRPRKTLNALSGVAYAETDKILALSNVAKLYIVGRVLEAGAENAHEGNKLQAFG
jgi:hypothetical protein